jgi:hypothetical protein
MKIKVVYGLDMRLWSTVDDSSISDSLFSDLQTYVCKTFGFSALDQFALETRDESDQKLVLDSNTSLKAIVKESKNRGQKSVKVYVVDCANDDVSVNDEDEKNENEATTEDEPKPPMLPTPDEIDGFFDDAVMSELFTELFCEVLLALSANQKKNESLTLVETMHSIIETSQSKYEKLVNHPLFAFLEREVLGGHCEQLQMLIAPYLASMGINVEHTQMSKQWSPVLLQMLRMYAHQTLKSHGPPPFHPFFGPFGGRGRGGRGFWRGPHGHHGHHRGRHGPHPWHPWHHWQHPHPPHDHDSNDDVIESEDHEQYHYHDHPHHHRGRHHGRCHRGRRGRGRGRFAHHHCQQHECENNDEFAFNEELVEILSMGFDDVERIKQLLTQHHGNKQQVVQQLIVAQ